MHPILSVLIRRPELVSDHLSSYAGLIREEAAQVGAEVAKRAVAGAIAAVCGLVFLVLAGVAAMLWALTGFHWMLVIAPGVFLVVAAIAGMQAMRKLPQAAFRETRSQLSADAQTLQALGARS
ncbi:phage holin family protein [Ramlibacter sp. AW1]|uniref:Phage holin family protein n=1 Tax=Ramlibacter aurantiacus TaxID=2801330 RepID=A0A936ZH45_9BURK|nr:phage holin family protein [Ramlibacter aurantiacus]MBL0420148.1 phage holin family protein [Ramlibacter aurantiacus]